MKAALIPPVAHLEEFCADDRFHLVLSHLLENETYLDFYRRQRLKGSYLVLDNGAHERTRGEPMRDLLTKALMIRASEIVLPDTLFDYKATVTGAEDAMKFMLGPGQDMLGTFFPPRLMLVPQGSTRQEWEDCFRDLVTMYAKWQQARPDIFPNTPVIGVSKDYDQWEGGHTGLLEFLESYHEWIRFDVHLLGWARELWVLSRLAASFPWIRSTDSAKPFVYAQHSINIGFWHALPPYPGRAPNYFDSTLSEGALRTARRNVTVFREAAHAKR